MKKHLFLFAIVITGIIISCSKEDVKQEITDQITIDSLTANHYSVKAWDTTTINCYATGKELIYQWEADHGNFNGSGTQIKYAAGECCVGINTITCFVSNSTGQVSQNLQIEVTSYFGDDK